MKKTMLLCLAGLGILSAMVSCSTGNEKITALVAGKDAAPVALVVEYADTIDAASVTPETYVVPGQEVEGVFVSDVNPFEAKPCKDSKPGECQQAGEAPKCPASEGCPSDTCKPEGPKPCPPKACKPESKNGKYVVIVLKHDMPEPCAQECGGVPPCPDSAKACAGACGDTCKGACGDSCKGACGDNHQCQDSAKACEGKGEKAGCDKKCDKDVPQAADIDITVQQAMDIKTAAGKTVKAWSAARKAAEVVPAMPGHHSPCGPQGPKGQPDQPQQPAPAEKPAEK